MFASRIALSTIGVAAVALLATAPAASARTTTPSRPVAHAAAAGGVTLTAAKAPNPVPKGKILSFQAEDCGAPGSCAAVGEIYTPGSSDPTSVVIDQLIAGTWRNVPLPLPAGTGVTESMSLTCPSATSCYSLLFAAPAGSTTAYPGYLVTVSGGSATLAALPAGIAWQDLVCVAAQQCMIAGLDETTSDPAFYTLDGTSHTLARGAHVPVQNISGFFGRTSFDCSTLTDCVWSIALNDQNDGTAHSYAERLSAGGQWEIGEIPGLDGASSGDVELEAALCQAPSNCLAAGWTVAPDATGRFIYTPIVASFDGAQVHVSRLSEDASLQAAVNGDYVSLNACFSVTNCRGTTGGVGSDGHGVGYALTVRNGVLQGYPFAVPNSDVSVSASGHCTAGDSCPVFGTSIGAGSVVSGFVALGALSGAPQRYALPANPAGASLGSGTEGGNCTADGSFCVIIGGAAGTSTASDYLVTAAIK